MVPYYDPGIVFFAPRPGFLVGGAIRFGFGVSLGVFFRPWGWGPGYSRFDWGGHAVFINNARWGRTWFNRGAYVHPYAGVHRLGRQIAFRNSTKCMGDQIASGVPREKDAECRRNIAAEETTGIVNI